MMSPSAQVSELAKVSESAKIWDYCQIRESAEIADNVIVGRGAYIGAGVKVGKNSKIQNSALIYEPAVLEDGVFVGPGAILTNDKNPRAINLEETQKSASDWHPVGIHIKKGASIGAGAVCVAPLNIGRWAIIAAGSVVTKDVPDFALVVGNPARQVGWVGRSGWRLVQDEDSFLFVCPRTGEKYETVDGKMDLI